jgi:hypothetical protein
MVALGTTARFAMYTQPQKKFRAKKIDDIEAEILSVVASGQKHQRVFLADGDAMTLPFKRSKRDLTVDPQTYARCAKSQCLLPTP